HAPADSLLVAEIFGPTVQGEGSTLGWPCGFLRLGGCNQSCAWCDTSYTWDWTGRNGVTYDPKRELAPRALSDIAATLAAMQIEMLVVTGGEPMLQQEGVATLLELSPVSGWRVEVETAGTIVPHARLASRVDQFNVSLKLAHSGNPEPRRRRPEAIAALRDTGKAVWKFVISEVSDFAEVDELVEAFDLRP